MTYNKPDIKALTAQGLSGWEAGRLILREGYWGGKGRGVLAAKEKEAIRKSLKTVEDSIFFNCLMDVGRVLELAQLKATITVLASRNDLLNSSLLINQTFLPLLRSQNPKLPSPDTLDILNILVGSSLTQLKVVKAFMVVMGEASRVLGLPEYRMEIAELYRQIESEIDSYNSHLKSLKRMTAEHNIQADLPSPINPKQVRPDSQVVKAWRVRIGRGQSVGGLGKGWWRKSWKAPES